MSEKYKHLIPRDILSHDRAEPMLGKAIATRCFACGAVGRGLTLDAVDVGYVDHNGNGLVFGIRLCPGDSCNALTAVVYSSKGELIDMYPKARVPFDATGVPRRIVDSYEEAAMNYTHGCYISCAIMLRKTLEELCEEFRAPGRTLVERLTSLKDQSIFPADIVDALQELRILGNDAAHIELRSFNNIGPEECEMAMKITEMYIDNLYRFKSIKDRLQSRKKTPGGTP